MSSEDSLMRIPLKLKHTARFFRPHPEELGARLRAERLEGGGPARDLGFTRDRTTIMRKSGKPDLRSPCFETRRSALGVERGLYPRARCDAPQHEVGHFHFLRTALCGLSLPMLPLSLPAAGSITALTRVGLPQSMASFTARLNSSGVVTWTPTPPNASINFS